MIRAVAVTLGILYVAAQLVYTLVWDGPAQGHRGTWADESMEDS